MVDALAGQEAGERPVLGEDDMRCDPVEGLDEPHEGELAARELRRVHQVDDAEWPLRWPCARKREDVEHFLGNGRPGEALSEAPARLGARKAARLD